MPLTVMSHDGLVSAAPLAVNGWLEKRDEDETDAEDRNRFDGLSRRTRDCRLDEAPSAALH
ncbi:hypothetical protein, partial [Mesorhizobium sp. M7A.F.Ca.US.005.03.2.1]|uniref:hypothetical protein n=1 Tax=Mesorhizobium sp. M7A.F.Ca.US.005.03.2.1 TaxID=2496737 RepID=UPI0019CF5A2E